MNDSKASSRKTHQVHLRVSVDEHAEFTELAARTELSLSELVRRRLRGVKIIRKRDSATLLNEIRRQGGLMKYLHFRGEPILETAEQITATAERIEAFIMTLDDPPEEKV